MRDGLRGHPAPRRQVKGYLKDNDGGDSGHQRDGDPD